MFTWLDTRRVWVTGAVGVLSALLALGLNANRWKKLTTVVVASYAEGLSLRRGPGETMRSFFGIHKIVVTPRGQYHVLMHGTTIHGAEKFQNDGSPVTGRRPITSVTRTAASVSDITAVRERKGAPLQGRMIGLGSGTLACAPNSARAGSLRCAQTIVDAAKDAEIFHLHPAMQAGHDARDRRRAEPLRRSDGLYDLIVVDAYSSDAIPIHLATEEAMKIYKDKLAPQVPS